MLLLNGKILDYNSERGKKVKEAMDEIRQRKKLVVYRNPKADSIKYFLSNGKREKTPQVGVILSASIQTADGWEDWSFTKERPEDNGEGYLTPRRKRTYVSTDITLDPKVDYEYIYYLENLCLSVKDGDIVKYEEEEIDKKKVRELNDEVDIKAMIISQISPISFESKGTEAYIRVIASGWGVVKAFDKSYEKVKLELLQKVNESEARKKDTLRGYKEFKEDVFTLGKTDLDGGTDIEIIANIQKALDLNILRFESTNKVAFIFTPIEKELVRIKSSEIDSRVLKLREYFRNHPEDYEMVLSELGVEAKVMLTETQVMNCGVYTRLKKWCKDLEIDYGTVNTVEGLQGLLVKRLKEIS